MRRSKTMFSRIRRTRFQRPGLSVPYPPAYSFSSLRLWGVIQLFALVAHSIGQEHRIRQGDSCTKDKGQGARKIRAPCLKNGLFCLGMLLIVPGLAADALVQPEGQVCADGLENLHQDHQHHHGDPEDHRHSCQS